MSDGARARAVLVGCLDARHERADHQVTIVCITCTTDAFAAEQTTALQREVELAREQAARLDREWPKVVDEALAQTAALRAQVTQTQTWLKQYGEHHEPLPRDSDDCVCGLDALLADAGQAGEEWRALNELAMKVTTWRDLGNRRALHILSCAQCKALELLQNKWCEEATRQAKAILDANAEMREALAAVERARQR